MPRTGAMAFIESTTSCGIRSVIEVIFLSRDRRRLRVSLSIQSLLFGSGTTRRNQAQDLRFDHHVHDVQQARTRIEPDRSEEHTSELQSLMRNSYAVFCLKKKKT